MISKEQIKAARAILDWTQKDLADKCGQVSQPMIKLIEAGKSQSTDETLGAIKRTFEEAGIEFLPQNGVRIQDNLLTIIEKQNEADNVYLKLVDDIYYSLKDTKGEVLHSFIDNALSPPDVIQRELMMRNAGINSRSLVRHGDTYLLYPLDEYRYLPKGYYLNNPTSVYADKFAVVVQDSNSIQKVIIIQNKDIANVKRKEFEIIWQQAQTPTKSTAEKTYV